MVSSYSLLKFFRMVFLDPPLCEALIFSVECPGEGLSVWMQHQETIQIPAREISRCCYCRTPSAEILVSPVRRKNKQQAGAL